MNNQDRLRLAYHEAGHAVAACASGLEVEAVSIEADEDSDGRATVPFRDDIACIWECSDDPGDDEYLEKHLVCYMAGAKAEEILTGEETDLEGTDLTMAADFVLHLAGPVEGRQLEVSGRASDLAERLLRRDWHSVERLSAALLDHVTLNREQAKQLMDEEE